MKALLAFPTLEAVVARAQESFTLVRSGGGALGVDEIAQLANEHQVDALFVAPRNPVRAELIHKLPATVKVISTFSVGFDHIDVAAAKAKGIAVTNTPEVLSEATANLAFLLLLAASRRLPEAEALMRQGWGRHLGTQDLLGVDLTGKTLAIFGMGRIGREMADRARAFGMKIVYCNRNRLHPDLEKGAAYFANFKEMLPLADALSLHAPASIETQELMNRETFALMKEGSIFVNTARGSLMNEDALIEALRSGHLFAAGLDVFSREPNLDPRFLELQNVVLAPHVGSATIETRTKMGFLMIESAEAVLRGETPPNSL